MRRFTRFMIAVDALLAMSLSSVLLWLCFLYQMDVTVLGNFLPGMLERLARDPAVRLGTEIAAVLVLVLHLVWLDRALRQSRRGNAIVLDKEDGSLIIAVSAVEDSLERAVQEQSGVRDVRVRVRVSPEAETPAEVVVVCSVQDAQGILAVEDRMRQAVRRRFQEILPQRALKVSVRMRRFLAEEGGKSRRAEGERIPLRPEYPLEGF